MSIRDSKVLIARYYRDFSSSSLGTSYASVITNLGANCKGVYIENTSGTPVSIAYGASGSEKEVDVSPISGIIEKSLLLSKTMDISIKSLSGTISTGKLLICIYN